MNVSNKFDGLARVFLGNKCFVFLWEPKYVEIILNSSVHLDKSFEYKYFQPWFNDGILISTGSKWKKHRKIMAPAFHQNVLKSFMSIFNKNCLTLVDRLKKENGNEFDAHDYMGATTVEILLGIIIFNDNLILAIV